MENLVDYRGYNFIFEKKKIKFDFGCAMLFFAADKFKEIHDLINPDHIYKSKDVKGIEDEPHVTLLYGLHKGVTQKEVMDICGKYHIDELEITEASLFTTNEDFDVLKFKAYHPVLSNMHEELSMLPNSDKFTEYRPHVTIAYLKKEHSKDYVQLLNGKRFTIIPSEIVYSTAKGKTFRQDA